MCIACFRKRWPRRKIYVWQVPEKLRTWEICCFCFKEHKSGIHMRKDPGSRELMCSVQAEKATPVT
jgi:hypothetical protein